MNRIQTFEPGSRVVAYLRDSGGSAQDLSINQQKNAILKWADENQIIVSLFYIDEAKPGTSVAGRKAFQGMIDHFRQPMVKESGLVLWSFSRFARDINSAMRYKSEIRSRGMKVISITDPIPDDEDGILFETINDWSNDKFSKRNAIEAKRGLHFNMDNFGAIGGIPPKGFKRERMLIGKHRDGSKRYVSKWVPDPETWETCKLAWQLRSEGKTYRQINEICHLFGAVNSYVTFFKNQLYRGDLVYGDGVIKNYADPMIDEETWQKVQNQISPRNDPRISEYHPRRSASGFLLSGLLFCSRCGAPMNGNVVQFSADEKPYKYYICSRAGQRHECNALRISKEAIEAAVFAKLSEYILNPELVYERQRLLLEDRAEESSSLNQKKIELSKRIKETKNKIRNLTEVIEESGKQSISLLARVSELENQERDLTNHFLTILDEEESSIGSISPEEARENAKSILANLDKQDPEDLKKLFNGLIHLIEAEKDRKYIKGSIQFFGPPDQSISTGTGSDSDGDEKLLEFMRKGRSPVGALHRCKGSP